MIEQSNLDRTVAGLSPVPPSIDTYKRRLLHAAGDKWLSSAKLLDMVDPCQSSDDARYAYWALVSEGRLIRGPKGVRKASGDRLDG
jgi:hypothetical protein